MVLILESCSLEECCTALGATTKLLFELRDRLRDWLKLQPHLPQDVPDHMLDHFILGTKMSLEQAKHKLDMSYTLKRYAPEIFMDRDPRKPCLAQLRKLVQIVYLPKLTPEKHAVVIMRPNADDYQKLSGADCFKWMYMLGLICICETHDLGSITVIDVSKVDLRCLASFTPPLIKKCETSATEAYAIRVKGIHFINATKLTNTIVNLVKSVLKPKIAKRVHAHLPGSYESLHKFVPKSILPKDYGGDEMSMDELAEAWRQKADEWRDWFLEQDKILVDERLRPGPAVDADHLFGTSGSFRKLDVD